MMEALIVILLLGIIVVIVVLPLFVLPIVTLVKISGIVKEIAELKRLLEKPAGPPKPEKKEEVRPLPNPLHINRRIVPDTPLTRRCPVSTACTVKIADKDTSNALDVFWGKVGDWFCVSGAFAPRGMTREFAVATHWLVRVGIMLMVAGIVYFVKLSIDCGWMGPTGRVVSMLFWGTVAAAAGTWLVKRTRYGMIGHAIAAVGVVALYLGFGLGHRFFDPPVIQSAGFAFFSLVAVTVCAGIMAVLLHSPTIAVMGLVGGYLVPVVAGQDSASPLGVDIYLLMLNVGAFAVTWFRRWSALDFLAAMLAFLLCFIWSGTHASASSLAVLTNFAFLSVIHAIYMASVIMGSKWRGRTGNASAWAGLAVNACAYLGWLALHFRAGFSNEMTGIVFLSLVGVYLGVASCTMRRGLADQRTVNILLSFALAYLSIAPLLLFDAAWNTVSWSIIAVATAQAERRTGQKILGMLALIILSAAAVSGIFYLVPAFYGSSSFSGVSIQVGGCHSPSAFLYFKELCLRVIRLWTLPVAIALVGRNVRGKLFVVSCVIGFLFYTCEAQMFGAVFLPSLKLGSITVFWAVLAFAGIWLGIARRVKVVRLSALLLLGVTIAKLLTLDTAHLVTAARVAVFSLTGVLLVVGAFLYIRFKERFETHE